MTVVTGSLTGQEPAVGEWLAHTGRSMAALHGLAERRPECGLAQALVVLADADALDHATLRRRLVGAHAAAQRAGAREQSLVYGIYLFTHRRYRAAADHLVVHFVQYPADEIAGSMLGAFDLAGPLDYREHGHVLARQQYALAGPESWTWASWAAGALAEEGRIEEARDLAQHALKLNPRSGPAAHARAHAEHEQGTGPAYTTSCVPRPTGACSWRARPRPGPPSSHTRTGCCPNPGAGRRSSTRIGGVRVEREIIQDTLARALIDAGQPQRAAHLLHHRTTTRTHHTYENLLLAAAEQAPTAARDETGPGPDPPSKPLCRRRGPQRRTPGPDTRRLPPPTTPPPLPDPRMNGRRRPE
ncbi:hypothetical protein [Streptomyces lavendulocolor]|uniref:hypothetical protein n=1 Tax=Streptomyces lavendulocolor TaxID=67316 RepID=UPI003C2FEA18